jgi:geranylgeranyl diphosphate synthase, type II
MISMIETYIRDTATMVHEELDRLTSEMEQVPEILLESMRYSLLAGGKRLRPVLVLATLDALGKDIRMGLPFACALEMIHTYSLIHDDLPAMDDDDYRRGKPTNHKLYGDAMAILAGDALLTESFGVVARGAQQANFSAEKSLNILSGLVRAIGAGGMIGGQVRDILSENEQINQAQLEQIHRHKTGDLIAYSVRIGALLGDADEETLQGLIDFAYKLGLAFQIQDDILDVVGDEELIGKPVGSDEEKQKATYPALIGLERSQEILAQLTQGAKDSILNLTDLNPEKLLQIADYLLNRNR